MSHADNEVTNKKIAFDFEHDQSDDYDQLHTPLNNGDDQEHVRFPYYINGEGTKFK